MQYLLVMLRYAENIDILFRYRYIEPVVSADVDVDFLSMHHRIQFLQARFYVRAVGAPNLSLVPQMFWLQYAVLKPANSYTGGFVEGW